MKKILLILLLSFVAACASNISSMKELRFNQKDPYNLNVGTIEIVDDNNEPDKISIDLPIYPDSSLKIWANDRIKSVSENKSKFKVSINKAFITETTIHAKRKLEEDQKLYKISLDVKFELYDNDPIFPSAEMMINVSRSKSIDDNKSLNEKRSLCYGLITDALGDLDSKFTENFPSYFNNIKVID
ncbi:hypothetical protein SZ25_00595 [Candidatus Arcanobacter lacustris]|uniref:Lipoprotein n=1 Tax=Candidatus Arcanibacter lacustris TaxID=1607817 RepID=A0A0F5MP44_9RICK|nr:hypothetical protein SZ25_00595 [Candidatus Arcanobacter lacustris]